MPSPISDCGQGDYTCSRNRERHLAADKEADSASKRSNGKRSCSGWRTRWASTFATFPLGANQEADPKCDGQVQDHGIDDGHSSAFPMLKRRLEDVCVSQERLFEELPSSRSGSERTHLDA